MRAKSLCPGQSGDRVGDAGVSLSISLQSSANKRRGTPTLQFRRDDAASEKISAHFGHSAPMHISEDWLAVILGLAIFVLGLATIVHVDLIGWVVNTSVWSSINQALGPAWSLRLTNEGAYIFALLAGLAIANFLPRFAEAIKEAVRPELYIKVAIVILGGFFAVTAAGKLSFASSLLLRGVAAIIEAYLIYWSVVYFIARKWFGFSREWSAPLAAGISICGVSASIAIGGAIRARPIVPALVSSWSWFSLSSKS
jgi:Conserved hypothetical protein 698